MMVSESFGIVIALIFWSMHYCKGMIFIHYLSFLACLSHLIKVFLFWNIFLHRVKLVLELTLKFNRVFKILAICKK